MDNPKATKLNKLFNSIVAGATTLTARNNASFLESISCSLEPERRVHAIINSAVGLDALRKSLTLDTSISFLNNSSPILPRALAAPDIADINGGSYIHKLIECIVQPPTTFWGALLCAFQANQLKPDAQESFAWLLLQVVLLPDNIEYDGSTINASIIETLLPSIAAEIKHVTIHLGSTPRNELLNGPGGRHDNDHVDFRQISILPTPDELESTSEAFLHDPKILKQRIIALPCILATVSVSCARIWLGRCGRRCRLRLEKRSGSTEVL